MRSKAAEARPAEQHYTTMEAIDRRGTDANQPLWHREGKHDLRRAKGWGWVPFPGRAGEELQDQAD